MLFTEKILTDLGKHLDFDSALKSINLDLLDNLLFQHMFAVRKYKEYEENETITKVEHEYKWHLMNLQLLLSVKSMGRENITKLVQVTMKHAEKNKDGVRLGADNFKFYLDSLFKLIACVDALELMQRLLDDKG